MFIVSLLSGIPSLKKLQGANNDDWVDRLNHVWTVFLMTLFAIVVTTGHFYGDPIECVCRGECMDFKDYVKSYCWIKNTYYIDIDDSIPEDEKHRKNAELTYYQWVPLILMFMALMFKFPNILWRLFNGGSGINLDKIVDMSEETQMGSAEDRDTTITNISMYMDRWLETNREYKWTKLVHAKQKLSRFCCFFCNKRAGKYLTAFYLFVKLAYAVNVISQFFILNAFMATEYNLYGFEVMKRIQDNKMIWKGSRLFPVNTLCDIKLRQMINVHPWTAQCVLPLNLFNEKIFSIIWFWLVLVATVTVINMICWLYRVVSKPNRARYIRKYLIINSELQSEQDQELCNKFADEYLRDDGVFVLRVIAKNSTDLVVTDLVNKLWKQYKVAISKRNEQSVSPQYDSRSRDMEKGTFKQRLHMFDEHKI